MVNVSNKQTAVYYLRNSQALIVNKEERIKTSAEIEEELYIKFPQLKQKMQKKNQIKLFIRRQIHHLFQLRLMKTINRLSIWSVAQDGSQLNSR